MMKLIKTLTLISASLLCFNATADPVNVNSADAAAISENLKGIGEKKAAAIVKHRKDNGKFKAADELQMVKGIGPKTVEKNRNDILISSASKKK